MYSLLLLFANMRAICQRHHPFGGLSIPPSKLALSSFSQSRLGLLERDLVEALRRKIHSKASRIKKQVAQATTGRSTACREHMASQKVLKRHDK